MNRLKFLSLVNSGGINTWTKLNTKVYSKISEEQYINIVTFERFLYQIHLLIDAQIRQENE